MKTLISTFLLLMCLPVAAQDFDLFEEVEAQDSAQPARQRPGREARVTTATPEFTLVGTSRIGDRYSVILKDRNGEKLVVRAEPGVNTAIPDYSEYQIVATANGKVSLQHPDSAPCIDFPEAGVRCNAAGNIAELTLSTNPPVVSSEPVQVAASADSQEAVAVEENPQNPFAIMRARAQSGDNPNTVNAVPEPGANGRFVPRRIDPAEVPPGMRVVSTPFGDRLVPQ